MTNRRPSLQDRIRQRQSSEFVGRDDQLALFRRNFSLPLDERIYIFNLFGQGGVGKTTLLQRYRELATASGAITGLTDHDQADLLTAMDQLARELARQGHALPTFPERYRTYRQRRQELESEPDAPTGLSSLFARTLVKGGLALARGIPVGGGLVDLVDDESVASKTGEWVEYVSRKLRNNTDEIRLVREPVEELTRLWLNDLNKIGENRPIVLFFDTYERTASSLDAWLREMLGGAYGPLPETTQLVIAGRDELDRNHWAEYESVIARLSLEPFMEAEARDFLARKGIVDERVIVVILHLSGRLPLLVAMLAAERPDDPAKVGDPSGTAVERFLIWTEDPVLRRAAVDAALARQFNRDLIALLVEEKQVDGVFDWLRRMPFVEERSDGWAYHAVVREQMLRYKRRESQQSWAALHTRLAEYFERRAGALGLVGKACWRDATWRATMCEVYYHKLCESPHVHLATALNAFVECRDATNLDNTEQLIDPLMRAGEHTDDPRLRDWATHLHCLVDADRSDNEAVCVEQWHELLRSHYLTPHNQAIALVYAGVSYRLLNNSSAAIDVLTQAIAIARDYTRAFAQRGVMLRNLNRYDEALADFTCAIELDPQYGWALAHRGETYRQLKRYDEALADFTRAIELNPQSSWPLAHRGETYGQLKRYDEALADLTRAIEPDSQYAWALGSRSQVYRQLKRYDEALADLTRAIELDSQYAWALGSRGQVYRQLKRYDEALADLTRTIELAPQYDWVLAERGETYRQLKRYDEALTDLTRAIELNPQSSWPLAHRGETYRQLKRYDEALADLTRAIELDSQYAWALGSCGQVYRQLKRYDEALTDLTRAIELNPQSSWPLAHRGETYRRLQRYDEALADLTRAIELDSQYAWALGSRGQVYRQLQRYDEALADLTRAIELNPQSSWYLYQRAIAYVLVNHPAAQTDFDLTIEQAHKEYEKDPKDWNNAFNIALYLIASNQSDLGHRRYHDLVATAPVDALRIAIAGLDDYLTSFPGNADAQTIRVELQAEIERRQADMPPA